jgi:hypothetical protein
MQRNSEMKCKTDEEQDKIMKKFSKNIFNNKNFSIFSAIIFLLSHLCNAL